MPSYLIIGGGPSARENIKRVKADVSIGSNRCLEFCNPGIYFVSDPNAIQRYEHLWREYVGELLLGAGTPVAVRTRKNMQREGIKHTYFPYRTMPMEWGRSCSGLVCAAIALLRGATSLTFIGFDGHKPEDWWFDKNDAPLGQYLENAPRRNENMAAAFRHMGVNNPEVSFELVGETLIELPIDLENWRHCV